MVSKCPSLRNISVQRMTFYKLLTDARDSAGLTTTNQAYTVVQGVFQETYFKAGFLWEELRIQQFSGKF